MGKFKSRPAKTGFSRPTADVTKHNRHWVYVPAKDLQEKDIVANVGLIKLVSPTCDNQVYIQAGDGDKEYFFDLATEVFAFVEKGN